MTAIVSMMVVSAVYNTSPHLQPSKRIGRMLIVMGAAALLIFLSSIIVTAGLLVALARALSFWDCYGPRVSFGSWRV